MSQPWLSCFVALLLGLVAIAGSAALAAQGSGSPLRSLRMSICLNGLWERALGSADAMPEQGWSRVRVPDLPLCDDGRPAGLWYRTSVQVPRAWLEGERRLFLELEKVGHYAAVFCNGKQLGAHYDQFSPFAVDLTPAILPGEPNEIAIYVHEASGRFARPGPALQDDQAGLAYRPAGQSRTRRNWVGIVGDITLSWRPAAHVEDVLVTTSFRQKRLTADVEFSGLAPDAAYECRGTVLDADRSVLELPATRVAPDTPLRLSAPWADFVPWNPPGAGEPKLYHLRVELVRDGQVVDRFFRRFGFREVWVEGKTLLLNGRRLWMVANYHPWLYPIRYNNDRRAIAQDIAAMQSAGINTLHGHWDDLGRTTLEVCDEMGMMVLSALFCDGQLAIKPRADEGWPDWAVDATRRWARARRGHPSIVAWRPFCGTPSNLGDLTHPGEWRRRVGDAVRSQDPTAVLADGSDVANHSQGVRGREGVVDDGSRMAQRAEEFNRPMLTNEIWASFQPFTDHERFFRAFYAKAWDAGTVGFVPQHLPYVQTDLEFRVTWPSESGMGNRSRHWSMRRGVNWCDPSAPAWRAEQYADLFRSLTKEITDRPPTPFQGEAASDLIVAGAKADRPVFLTPLRGNLAPALGVMPDKDGSAWFTVHRTGKYAIVQGERALEFAIVPAPIAPAPGYGHIPRIRLPDSAE
jgi:glycosyl hydrolase family 2